MPNIILPLKGITRKQDASYSSDSGMDLAVPVGTPVYSPCDGRIIYSEYGHTEWGTKKNVGIDTPYSILIQMKATLRFKDKDYFFCWLTHLSKLQYQILDGSGGKQVEQGELLGYTGKGNNNAHLHFGILIRRAQKEGDFMLPETMKKFFWDYGGIGDNDRTTIPPENEEGDRIVAKVFYHDGKMVVSWDGVLYQVLAIGSGVIEIDRKPLKEAK